ncbi:hypothetical protein B0H21DRAFT_823084 [Amylocystis lapponica]|nr:hypothetical protein B0H21DRAFT_823084 [Amylocystis lapponica]
MSPSPPAETTQAAETVFTIILNYHTLLKPAAGSRAQPKDKVESKVKEIKVSLSIDGDSYTAFLLQILQKHNESKYTVTDKKRYPFKYSFLTSKKNHNDTVDVDNESDWVDFVGALIDREAPKVTIIINMDDVIKVWNNLRMHGSDNEGDEDNEETIGKTYMSASDKELARIRIKLEKKWPNQDDAGFSFIPSNGGPCIPLMPFLIKEWARAIYDGEATIYEHPNTQSFDPANLHASLHPSRRAAAAPASTPVNQISDLASILNAVTGLIGATRPAPKTPSPRMMSSELPLALSPSHPSPSQLSRYLDHAARELGVQNATQYQYALENEHYGPDILPTVLDEDLVHLGIPKGDIIRFKNGSTGWYNSARSKRKHDGLEAPGVLPMSHRSSPGAVGMEGRSDTLEEQYNWMHSVSYEEQYADGGARRFHGPPMIAGESNEVDGNLHYFNNAMCNWLPIPLGYTVLIADDVLMPL